MHRVFVEKKPEFNSEARRLLQDLRSSLELPALSSVRVLQRYDVEGLDDAEFAAAVRLVLSEPQVDAASPSLTLAPGETAFAVEYLPGQFDQRADSAAQCVQILTAGRRPLVASARVIALGGALAAPDVARVKACVINTVDSREASMTTPASLAQPAPPPPDVPTLEGFRSHDPADLERLRTRRGLAMSPADLAFCQHHFRTEERRDPTLTELRLLDTYWSDHCRHTTFRARIEEVSFDPGADAARESWDLFQQVRAAVHGPGQPVTLMDIALLAMRDLRRTGELANLELSEEVNAASIIVPVTITSPRAPSPAPQPQDWLVLFKNETHNHPTEIEPFGGAATCLGGAIRDPLSGRAYVYQAMRVTGAGDPRTPFAATLPGKLPQRRICQLAAHGYSSYGNQVGLATGMVSEVYHPGYVAKRMEVGAVVAAAPRDQVVRGRPAPGDVILLVGGRTGRDGIGGATGSSKRHGDDALANSAEVQKGDPPTERKIQRLFRDPVLARRIKVCNDFGAGGVAVAIGEIARSLDIDLDRVPRKYDGLDGTELAISESQERMAVLVDPADVPLFIAASDRENLECTPVATVADHGRLRMTWRGATIADLPRAFLDSNGVQQSATARVAAPSGNPPPEPAGRPPAGPPLAARLAAHLSSLDHCSRKGLGEMFDSSIGAATVLSPFGGERQLTPPDAMVARLPVLDGHTDTGTFMSWGFDPRLAAWSPYHGALWAVTESVCRLVASGARLADIRLTLQEYFPKPGTDPARWGLPLAALLGAFHAQHALRLAAIGGKDSMSGSFNHLDVPPTLVSFAVAPGDVRHALSPEFKQAGSRLSLVCLPRDGHARPDFARLRETATTLHQLAAAGHLLAVKCLGAGGLAHGLALMAFGNHLGAEVDTAPLRTPGDGAGPQPAAATALPSSSPDPLFTERHGAFLIEHAEPLPEALAAVRLGRTIAAPVLRIDGEAVPLDPLVAAWTATLEPVYPTRATSSHPEVATVSFTAARGPRAAGRRIARPRVVIPVFPGTNCEYDTARAFQQAGADPAVLVFRNLTPAHVDESLRALAAAIRDAQILMLPGGFSAGDEPDGSGKFIATVLRNPRVAGAIMDLVDHRDGLILGICNGFQALVKVGLLPGGTIRAPHPASPTLTFNDIGRHVSTYVRTRVASTLSPWLARCRLGDIHRLPVSHGEGKFHAPPAAIRQLAAAGQVAFQYCDAAGNPSMDIAVNPNGSMFAIEAVSSPDGRILGKMAHTERRGPDVARNIPGNKHQPLFTAGVEYFTG